MSLTSCRRCKKLFNHFSGPSICSNCEKEIEQNFFVVKEYLNDNPRHSIKQISENTQVPVSLITQFLKEGRILLADTSSIVLRCEKCNSPIKNGKLCRRCQSEMISTINDLSMAYKQEQLLKEQESRKAKLHFKP